MFNNNYKTRLMTKIPLTPKLKNVKFLETFIVRTHIKLFILFFLSLSNGFIRGKCQPECLILWSAVKF